MKIKIKELRIRNFRSYKTADINLSDNCVLIGANNVGKTTLLRAVQVAFTRGIRVGSDDIFIMDGESLPKDREAIIDVLIVPTDDQKKEVAEFDDQWFEHFGELRGENPNDLSQFFAMRTIIAFNYIKEEYEIEKKALIEWPKSEEVESYTNYNRNRITDRVLQAIPIFYMDAKRDIAAEMKDRYSYWGKLVRDVGLNEQEIKDIEAVLDDINNTIIERSSVLKHLIENLSKVSKTVSTSKESIKVNPVSRKIKDLNRGIDITFKDQGSESFPISNHGMGTRSWITFLTLVAYIEWINKQMKNEETPYHSLILLEEPEAHLHPQAQRKIFNQINGIAGQKIVSSHSPMIVGQVDIDNIRHISKEGATSKIDFINTSELSDVDLRKIRQEILKTRGDLLFANAIILCEGETEEQVLPSFFKEYFGIETFEVGINVISVGGKGKYKPFIRIAKDLNIKFYILSDGEDDTIKKVKKDAKNVFGEEKVINVLKNIKFLPNGCDFEKYLIEEKYDIELDIAMKEILGEDYLANHIQRKDGTKKDRKPSSEICRTCNQNIYEDIFRDYKGEDGEKKALLDCIHDNKTAYSSIIAEVIIENREEGKIPRVISDLFKEINNDLKIIDIAKDLEEVTV